MLQQSFTVWGGYSSRTSSRFSRDSIRCVRAASITSLRGGSSCSSDATISLALSSSRFRSSLNLRVVRSVPIVLCAYGVCFGVVSRWLAVCFFKYPYVTVPGRRRDHAAGSARSIHVVRGGAYADVHIFGSTVTLTSNPTVSGAKTALQKVTHHLWGPPAARRVQGRASGRVRALPTGRVGW